MYTEDTSRAQGEMAVARTRLLAAERGAIHRAIHDGLISRHSAVAMVDAADRHIKELTRKLLGDSAPADEPASDVSHLRTNNHAQKD